MEPIGLILSSAVIAAIFSSVVTLYVTERSYRNEYYKKIVEKRFYAHESINSVISRLKLTVPDKDGQCYHAIFGWEKEEYRAFVVGLAANEATNFWVTKKTHDAILNLNKEFFRCFLLLDEMNGNLVEVGKKEYVEIGRLRDTLEDCMRRELPTLHKVRKFLNGKSVIKGYEVVDLKKRPSE